MTGGTLRLALLLTTLILVVEAVAGVVSGSLALLSDAGHVLTDVLALALAWFAVVQSSRPADRRRTYGYQRVGILAAGANAAMLVLIVVLIAVEAVNRLVHPKPVNGLLVVASAVVAIGVNLFIASSLRGDVRNLNIRAALLHVVGDLAASVGVVIAGAVILLSGWLYADPIVSLLITALIGVGAWRIVADAINVLLEGVPSGIDLVDVQGTIIATPGVESVHDLHVWGLSGESIALSCHVVVPEDQPTADSEHLVRDLEQSLCSKFDIGHTTIQVESCHPCAGDPHHDATAHNHPHPTPRVGPATHPGQPR
jgi:cobalt-zinc-cadmium efflux system protein